MIQNDEEKSWMLPLLEFRNYIAAYNQDVMSQNEMDRSRRDFRRMTGGLTCTIIDQPRTIIKEGVREEFLERLLKLQLLFDRPARSCT